MSIEATRAVLKAFLTARWRAVRLRTMQDLKAHQRRGLQSWRTHVAEAFPHIKSERLAMDKATLMSDFAAFNQGGFTADEVRNGLDTGYVRPGIACGTSTGTSGNRGLYVITDHERYQWLGTILAKGLPDVWRRRHRVAVILPQSSALYQAGNQSRWLKLQFYDLRQEPEAWAQALEDFNPTVLIAPPKVLRWLAENRSERLHPQRVFSGAETLDPPDQRVIEAGFGLKLGQIYMATEGLFAVSCSHGTLHLTEDYVAFDFEDAGEGLVSPRITDFSRRYQLMANYAMNDLLKLSETPCLCGSPLQAVEAVVGRQDDVFWFGEAMVTPDVLRNAVLDSDPTIQDFRVQQRPDGTVVLQLAEGLPPEVKARARQALTELLAARQLSPKITLQGLNQTDLFSRKLRRVERLKA